VTAVLYSAQFAVCHPKQKPLPQQVTIAAAVVPAPPYMKCGLLAFPEALIFICFGLDSSRFAIRTVKAPLRYSARMLSELTYSAGRSSA
jgi:hypothetical protein